MINCILPKSNLFFKIYKNNQKTRCNCEKIFAKYISERKLVSRISMTYNHINEMVSQEAAHHTEALQSFIT